MKASRAGARLNVSGYRVCIFFDNSQDAPVPAKRTVQGIKVYMVYEIHFRSLVRDCLTTGKEPSFSKGRVSSAFPKAFVKNGALSIADNFETENFLRFRIFLVFYLHLSC